MIQKRKESASLLKRGHSASNVTIKTYKFPLPHHATWGNTQNHDHKLSVLSKVIQEHISISVVAWIDIQRILPWCLYPFGRHQDEPEDKCLDAACCFESKLLHAKPLHDAQMCGSFYYDTIIQDGRGWETAHTRPIWLKKNAPTIEKLSLNWK